jgi:hypothetical protein
VERRRRIWPWITALLIIGALVVVGVSVVLPEVQKLLKLKDDVVRFQKAAQAGPGAFTPPADARASLAAAQGGGGGGGQAAPPAGGGGGGGETTQAPTGGGGGEPEAGTFGGSGSDRVCDREKLIKYLQANPDRLRAFAETLGIEATPEQVAAYIRKLRPVILTKDTQVTNHAFKDGAVSGYQAIMAKGTAVLVDKDGKPVTRCRCGNPLKPPVALTERPKCIDCPPGYEPPPPCDYINYDDQKYQQSSDQELQSEYQSDQSTCYKPDPDPPPVEEDGEPPPDEGDCVNDPSQPSCQEQCQDDPTQPWCDGDTAEGETQQDQQTDGGVTDGVPTDGGAPTDGGGAPTDGGGAPTDGGGAPPQQ